MGIENQMTEHESELPPRTGVFGNRVEPRAGYARGSSVALKRAARAQGVARAVDDAFGRLNRRLTTRSDRMTKSIPFAAHLMPTLSAPLDVLAKHPGAAT